MILIGRLSRVFFGVGLQRKEKIVLAVAGQVKNITGMVSWMACVISLYKN